MKADKGLIKGAAQLAQTNLIAQQQKMQAIEGFGQTFSSVYNMIQQQKNAEKLAEKELYEDQRARYKEEMKDVNDVDYSFEALNAEQVNMYREFATGKKQRYSEIFYELENKSLTQQQRNDLEFEKSVILSDLRNSAASLASATERQNKTRESYEAGDISDSNFYTDPGSMSNLYDTMMRNNFSIDERGNAIVDTNYNLKATEQANDFIKINEDIRKQVRTYGINPLEKEEDKLLRRNKIENSLDDGEVLSFMFDDLDINNGGYYDSILAKNPQLKNKFNEMRTHLSDPNKRKEAIKYFKSVVSGELMLGIDSNIKAGAREYEVKNPTSDPPSPDDDKRDPTQSELNRRDALAVAKETVSKFPKIDVSNTFEFESDSEVNENRINNLGETEVVNYYRNQYEGLGLKFEEALPGRNGIEIKARNGNTLEISLSKDNATSEIRKFIKLNAKPINLGIKQIVDDFPYAKYTTPTRRVVKFDNPVTGDLTLYIVNTKSSGGVNMVDGKVDTSEGIDLLFDDNKKPRSKGAIEQLLTSYFTGEIISEDRLN